MHLKSTDLEMKKQKIYKIFLLKPTLSKTLVKTAFYENEGITIFLVKKILSFFLSFFKKICMIFGWDEVIATVKNILIQLYSLHRLTLHKNSL
jgi:hypothetical protein